MDKLKCPECGNLGLVIKQSDGRTKSFTVFWVFCEECKFDGVIEVGTRPSPGKTKAESDLSDYEY